MDLADASAILGDLRPRIDAFIAMRGDLAELQAELSRGGSSHRGGLAEVKALQARLAADLDHFATLGAEVKGFAPLLLDFPGDRAGVPVRWCWLEGDLQIAWYHRLDTGFAGRRPV